MIVYGRQAIREALRGPRRVRRAWAAHSEPWLPDAELADPAELERICGSAEHQGFCADVEDYRYADAAALLASDDALVVALDEIQDPQNLGAVCRVAECAGAAGVVIGERRAAQVSAAVCKASAGAVEHLRVARVRNLADYLAETKAAGAWVYGASAAAGATPYDEPDYQGRVVLVLGSEGRGLRPRVSQACDALVAVPLLGQVESLNVAAACAVVVYGILQFRKVRLDRGS